MPDVWPDARPRRAASLRVCPGGGRGPHVPDLSAAVRMPHGSPLRPHLLPTMLAETPARPETLPHRPPAHGLQRRLHFQPRSQEVSLFPLKVFQLKDRLLVSKQKLCSDKRGGNRTHPQF